MPKLIGTDGNLYYSFDLQPGKYTIGRNKDCDFYIPNKTMSRKHAEIEVTDANEIFIKDLGSHNGTSINNLKILDKKQIKPGDTLALGQIELKISDTNSEISSVRPSATAKLMDIDPDNSVYLSIDEALKPLPSKVTDQPELFPALSEIARTLVLHEPREVMLNRALELVNKVIPAERLAILFSDEQEDDIYTEASLLTTGSDPGQFTLSKTIANDIIAEKKAVLVADPFSDPKYAQQHSIIASNIKSAMAVPLFDEGRVLGILYVDTRNPLHRYSDDYLRLLATFGNIIASRLVNYMLLEEREEKKVMEAELNRASGIQKRLLPAEVTKVEGYEMFSYQDQCRAVGGDLYDMTLLPDGRSLFLVGDVSDKGMGAALLMSNILASFRVLYSRENFDLTDAVAEVSRQLFRFSNPGDFATLFVAIIDPRENKLTYINAGHNPPMMIHNDGSIDLLEPSGFMIGAFNFGDWTESTIEFNPQDTIIVFSDGVTEAEGKEGQYGEERLEKFLIENRSISLPEMSDKLVNEIAQFTDGIPQSDDITILFTKRVQ